MIRVGVIVQVQIAYYRQREIIRKQLSDPSIASKAGGDRYVSFESTHQIPI